MQMFKEIIPTQERYGKAANHYEDDDFIDRLNNRWTVRALIMCILVISGNMFATSPISCWLSSEFSGPQITYTNNICWLKGSYYLPTDEISIPDRSKPRTYFISYYQWTPFILLVMTLLFLCPRFLWHAFPRKSGINIRRLVFTIKSNIQADNDINNAKHILKVYLDRQYRLRKTTCFGFPCPMCYFGHTLAYFILKLIYLTNTISQFFLLNTFLSFHFTSYGVEAVKKLFRGEDWFESPRFPRVTMCDFMVRRLGSNQHWYAVQCTLPINLYNEKIFLGIWFWLIILTVFNILSIISWLISLIKSRRAASIRKYLEIGDVTLPSRTKKNTLLVSTTTSKKERIISNEKLHDFMKYLHIDGYLIFRLIGRNTDDIVAGKIIDHLYKNYKPSDENQDSTA